MPRKKHTPEEIVAKLRQVYALVSQGFATAERGGSVRLNSQRGVLKCKRRLRPIEFRVAA